jgi:hypothetical protein
MAKKQPSLKEAKKMLEQAKKGYEKDASRLLTETVEYISARDDPDLMQAHYDFAQSLNQDSRELDNSNLLKKLKSYNPAEPLVPQEELNRQGYTPAPEAYRQFAKEHNVSGVTARNQIREAVDKGKIDHEINERGTIVSVDGDGLSQYFEGHPYVKNKQSKKRRKRRKAERGKLPGKRPSLFKFLESKIVGKEFYNRTEFKKFVDKTIEESEYKGQRGTALQRNMFLDNYTIR